MLELPWLTAISQGEQTIEQFMGYYHEDRITEGAFYETKNLTSDKYPMLAVRKRRQLAGSVAAPYGMLGNDRHVWVDGNYLWIDGVKLAAFPLSLSTSGFAERQVIRTGSYVVVFPDGAYCNLEDTTDRGWINNTVSVPVTNGRSVTVTPCDANGNTINYGTFSPTAPENPTNGQYWLDNSSVPHSLMVYSSDSQEWTGVATTYVRLDGIGINDTANHEMTEDVFISDGFEEGDCVYISGFQTSPPDPPDSMADQVAALNGYHVIQKICSRIDTAYSATEPVKAIVITGLVDQVINNRVTVKLKRQAPKMDFVCEANNRIWGCYYGTGEDGKQLNEIYCCALGDFKNWRRYTGISTDSYAASCGTDGPWTGAINYGGYPCFFKENRLHKVYVSSDGAHQIVDSEVRGVQAGCERSMAILDGRLYYKSRDGICVYDGSLPSVISTALGNVQYTDAVGGSIGSKYYVSMKHGTEYSFFCYDSRTGIWMHEDDLAAKYMARVGNSLYVLTTTGSLYDIAGDSPTEGELDWLAETGIIGFGSVGHKSVSRFNIRMRLPYGSRMSVFIQYDSEGPWMPCGAIAGRGTNTFLLPVRPRRCDHFRLKLTGHGDAMIYSFSKVYEEGSDGG